MSMFTHMIARAALVLGVLTASAGALSALPAGGVVVANVNGQAVTKLVTRYERDMAERREMEREMIALEDAIASLAMEIERIKVGGVTNLERRALQPKLQESRRLAEELAGMQREVKALESSLEKTSRSIVRALDAERLDLERQLVSARGAEQRALVKKLNDLSQARQRYAKPLPRVDTSRIDTMLEMAQLLDDPDEMLSLADELDDEATRVQSRLDALAEQKTKLESQRRLLRRSKTFGRQERFFEEADRTRAVATRVGVTDRSGGGGRRATSLDGATSEDVANQAPPQAAPEPMSGSANNDSAEAPVFDAVGEDVPEAGLDETGGLGAGGRDADAGDPSTPVAGNDDFDSGFDDGPVVVERQADPGTISRGAYFDDAELDARIDDLEDRERKLERQAKKLKNRAKKLRTEANEFE